MARECLMALVVCCAGCGMGPLPEPPPPPAKGFAIAARPDCGADAHSVRRPADIAAAARRGTVFTCGGVDNPLPLDEAIYENDLERARALLAAGAEPNARWQHHGDRFPLQEALVDVYHNIGARRAAFVRLLLAHGADPNARWCPFESRSTEIPDMPACTAAHGMTPLVYAAWTDQVEAAYRLLDAGADPMPEIWTGQNALDVARGAAMFDLIAAAMFPKKARDPRLLADLERRRRELPGPPTRMSVQRQAR